MPDNEDNSPNIESTSESMPVSPPEPTPEQPVFSFEKPIPTPVDDVTIVPGFGSPQQSPPAPPAPPVQPPPPPVYPPNPYGYYGQPQYPQPQYYAPRPQTSLPLIALLLGIGGFFFSFISSIPAIILGIMGRKKAKELNQPTSMATAGLVLGIVSTILWALYIIFIIFFIIFAASTGMKMNDASRNVSSATAAANEYYSATGTYEDISMKKLEQYGYIPISNLSVKLYPYNSTSLCVESTTSSSVEPYIHMNSTFGTVVPSYAGRADSSESQNNNNWSYGRCSNSPEICSDAFTNCDNSTRQQSIAYSRYNF